MIDFVQDAMEQNPGKNYAGLQVGGIPQGTFLLAFYENEEGVSEALLLRALKLD